MFPDFEWYYQRLFGEPNPTGKYVRCVVSFHEEILGSYLNRAHLVINLHIQSNFVFNLRINFDFVFNLRISLLFIHVIGVGFMNPIFNL